MKAKRKNPYDRICPLCDESYDSNSERAKVHEHPEPQSGPPRDAWLKSRLAYEVWIVQTQEGRDWAAWRMKQKLA